MQGIPDVAVVLPSRNERDSIGSCIAKAKRALEGMGLSYEIIVADNSTDGTDEVARSLGATVITPDGPGYGYAYRYAFKYIKSKYGRFPKYVVMSDADDTYDLLEIPKLLEPLTKGEADMVIGSRLRGRIEKGAMPFLHRYIGNPLLTFFLNVFHGAGVSDAHSGFRAIRGEALEKLELRSSGMEFASELIMEAVKKGLRIAEVPISYYRRRGGSSKLSPLSDGWRHLKFMLLAAPTWLFIYPGSALILLGLGLMGAGLLHIRIGFEVGPRTMVLGSLLALSGYQALYFGIFSKLIHGELSKAFTLERGLAAGLAIFAIGLPIPRPEVAREGGPALYRGERDSLHSINPRDTDCLLLVYAQHNSGARTGVMGCRRSR